ncbi:class I SAM-dependent methyltransferase [Fibrobacterota bacterium]
MLAYVPKTSEKILELGCGKGYFAGLVKKNIRAEMWGMEVNDEVAEEAEKIFDKVIIGDLNHEIMNLPSRYFDCVIMNDVLEHLIDPVAVLKAVKGKCRPKAKLVCSIPNVRYYKILFDLIFKKEWKYQEAGVLDRSHLRFFTRRSIIDMFDAVHCNVLKIEGINPIYSKKFALFNALCFGLLSDTIYIQFACVAEV